MNILQIKNVTKRFEGKDLFSQINMDIPEKGRIGLVGRNGVGKSTLIKMIVGQENIDEGEIIKNHHLTIGYLAQNNALDSKNTIWGEMLTVFKSLRDLENQMHRLENQMSEQNVIEHPAQLKQVTHTYDQVQLKFNRLNGYGYKAEIRTVLAGFNFHPKDYDKRINELSGGQQTQLALAKLLLEKRDLLILDEPTNHLDVKTITWLENYIQGYPGALLIVSHDRYFMDKIVNHVYDLEHKTITSYHGNYSDFVKEKKKRYYQQLKAYQKQQGQIKKEKEFIKKNISRASTTKRAQARRKQLAKIKKIEKPLNNNKVAQFRFTPKRKSGNVILNLHNLAIGYDHNVISSPINLDVKRHQEIAVIGPNGIGKSTLLKTILGQIPKINGSIHFGTGIDIGYYDQHQEILHNNKTVLNELWDDHPTTPEGEIRSVLGSFLFSGEEVKKMVHDLSGGEKARLLLTKLAMQHDNFLLLDEPTNHLDIDSREILEKALRNFDGTILFISHDRYFINQIATEVVKINQNGSKLYLGNYDYYIDKKAEEDAIKQQKLAEIAGQHPEKLKSNANNSSGKKNYLKEKELQKQKRKLSRTVKKLEKQLDQLENEKQQIEEKMTEPEVFNDLKKSQNFQKQLDQINNRSKKTADEWEQDSLKLEQL
ncbi:ABC transporter ATP-binding protein [Philodulcilactobacillus myokoensis]|uniref:ABC transporter ATP-binding protein n=1 Tax=Philodulcilactobacillus myokoensis TaxID=2929573 RepID=A0A9W6ESK3_9LACO|nr:ATP-binding cassette domain-containing protein [Philodulcilactobacillus myokoensis]GLB47151.1 ABC transporter ATP-binding protein [Philodulcilactobacillus myokoensis]